MTYNYASISQYVQFGYRKASTDNIVLKMAEIILEKVNSYKYLGTVINNKLNCEAQYNKVLQTLSGKEITFSKIRYLRPKLQYLFLNRLSNQFLTIMTFFYNMLNFEKRQKLQSMQNRFLRIVFRNENLTTAEMHVRMGVGKLDNRRNLHLGGQMYRRSRIPEYLDNRNLATRQFDKKSSKSPRCYIT